MTGRFDEARHLGEHRKVDSEREMKREETCGTHLKQALSGLKGIFIEKVEKSFDLDA